MIGIILNSPISKQRDQRRTHGRRTRGTLIRHNPAGIFTPPLTSRAANQTSCHKQKFLTIMSKPGMLGCRPYTETY
jgi:hypothetical protein